MPNPEQTEAHVAHHEAGHFVARHVLVGLNANSNLSLARDAEGGFTGTSPSLDPPPYPSPDFSRDDPATLELQVVILFAGAAAELRFDPARQDDVRLMARGDLDLAAEWISNGLKDAEREQELKLAAATLVAQHWPAIHALAESLLAERWNENEKCLGGSIAIAIIERHTDHQPLSKASEVGCPEG